MEDLEDLSDILVVRDDGIFSPQFCFHPIKLPLEHQLQLFSLLRVSISID